MMTHAIHTLDLHFQGETETIATYLVQGTEGWVLVETGPGSTLLTLQAQLRQHGVQPADVQHVIVTHIHFDHAGAAGWWAQNGATIYVHYFGAAHLINPEKLIASATRIYGDQMERLWGQLLPAPAEKVVSLHDGDVIAVAGLTFTAVETPGHARHHHVIKLGNVAFTGDVAGMKLGSRPLLDIPAPPPEFDLEAWQASLDKLLGMGLERIYPTHFGAVENVSEHLQAVKMLVYESAHFVQQKMAEGVARDDLIAQYTVWNHGRAQAAGLSAESIRKYEIANPLYMSVDGMMRYWRKRNSEQ
ncbi:MAG: MBL fold metallo-hydrolase [Chloroflexi bacterium]|nr:MBL fold metallo-hydrolase [Ardenticatenaceae bacterium]MBL1130053.1 MBL fold metallo-hydrolase [Chloroflexota bacterium]NOG36140.1 MBL fold metallo-hydrolase [Chloroflexota bacterium]GIK57841.1 MAG: MBL fold hydrolase [Chloroflexota bacterium]